MRYVQIDTQSDPLSLTQPSTEKQKDLSGILVSELKEILDLTKACVFNGEHSNSLSVGGLLNKVHLISSGKWSLIKSTGCDNIMAY